MKKKKKKTNNTVRNCNKSKVDKQIFFIFRILIKINFQKCLKHLGLYNTFKSLSEHSNVFICCYRCNSF